MMNWKTSSLLGMCSNLRVMPPLADTLRFIGATSSSSCYFACVHWQEHCGRGVSPIYYSPIGIAYIWRLTTRQSLVLDKKSLLYRDLHECRAVCRELWWKFVSWKTEPWSSQQYENLGLCCASLVEWFQSYMKLRLNYRKPRFKTADGRNQKSYLTSSNICVSGSRNWSRTSQDAELNNKYKQFFYILTI